MSAEYHTSYSIVRPWNQNESTNSFHSDKHKGLLGSVSSLPLVIKYAVYFR